MKVTIGVDNGSSGSVGIIGDGDTVFFGMPVKEELHYSKKGNIIKRVDWVELQKALSPFIGHECQVFIERPFTAGPAFVNTMLLSQRSYEAVIITLELLELGHKTIDSKEWQSTQLPGVKGSSELKKASKLRGIQLYPALAHYIKEHGDADGLLIARHYHNRN